MGLILIIIAIIIICARKDKKKRHHRTFSGKSDWEKTCDDGGKFFDW